MRTSIFVPFRLLAFFLLVQGGHVANTTYKDIKQITYKFVRSAFELSVLSLNCSYVELRGFVSSGFGNGSSDETVS